MGKTPKTKKEKMLAQIKQAKVMSARELKKYISGGETLRRMADTGEIIPLGSGFYATTALDPFVASVIAVCRYYPKTVISNLTALVIHELSDHIIERIDVDIERNQSIRNRLLRVHRVSARRLLGMQGFSYHGETIRIYDKERTLAEAYLIDPAGSIFFKALKRYLKQQEPDMDKIQKYDQTLKTRVLEHLRQELADG